MRRVSHMHDTNYSKEAFHFLEDYLVYFSVPLNPKGLQEELFTVCLYLQSSVFSACFFSTYSTTAGKKIRLEFKK